MLRRTRQARRIQIVYDIGLLIGPFGEDLRHLMTRLRALTAQAVRVELAFKHRLSAGCGSGPIWTWRSYRPPPFSAVVIVVSGSFGGDPGARQSYG